MTQWVNALRVLYLPSPSHMWVGNRVASVLGVRTMMTANQETKQQLRFHGNLQYSITEIYLFRTLNCTLKRTQHFCATGPRRLLHNDKPTKL